LDISTSINESEKMVDEPTNKRRRLTEDECAQTSHHGNKHHPLFSPGEERARIDFGFENMDPFLSPATASSWPFDEFAHDPDYLASQEALRSLMFDTARSTAPTRAGTPTDGDGSAGTLNVKRVLADGRRVLYLKNYMSQVAPWVSVPFTSSGSTHMNYVSRESMWRCIVKAET
jgi:hypothetical protein